MPTGDPNRPIDLSNTETVESSPALPGRRVVVGELAPANADPQVWNLLRNCRALATLSRGALADVLAAATQRSFDTGDALITQGDAAEGLLILLDGAAHALLRSDDGEDRCIGRFGRGDLVGEMALVTREPRTATIIADSPVRALLVPTAAFDQLAVRHLELGAVLTELVANRLGQSAVDGFGGKSVGGFRILRCIGRGGMSVVYRAREESTDQLVALKMMSYRLIYDSGALARFSQEADILRSLDHENIARLQRLFPAYHTYFLVMELCDGVDLHRLVKSRGRLAEPQVRAILGQLARALDYVHRRGLVHRDLKPGNVMITRGGDVKLTDFGLAIPAVGPDNHTGIPGLFMGTPAFMAPEQLSGGQLDSRTDVYALGCLAYELLTGHHLFKATSVFDLVQEKLTLQVPPAADLGEGISADLHAFLQGALRVKPDERPPSVASLLPWAAKPDPPPQDLVDDQVGT